MDFTEADRCNDVTRWEGRGSDEWKPWRVVLVVVEAGRISGCRPPSCVEISRDDTISFKLTATFRNVSSSIFHTPLESSKNPHTVAYLWTISQGASVILDVDCSVFQRQHFHDFIKNVEQLHVQEPRLLYRDANVAFDAFHHFGFYNEAELKEKYYDHNTDTFLRKPGEGALIKHCYLPYRNIDATQVDR